MMAALNLIVGNLDRRDKLVPTARHLAIRHVGYGVRAGDYDTVGEALLWTLRQGLGSAASEETMAAWAEAYQTLAGVMKDAACPAPEQRLEHLAA